MFTYAVISNNTVENTIVADSQEIAEQLTGKKCIEYVDNSLVQAGAVYDEVNNEFYKPSDAVVLVKSEVIEPLSIEE